MREPNHYGLLGVPQNATTATIKKRYYELARTLHPDKNGGSAEKSALFVKIVAAYAVLGDAQKRADYDLRLRTMQNTSAHPQPPPPIIPTNPIPVNEIIISDRIKIRVKAPGRSGIVIDGKETSDLDETALALFLIALGLAYSVKFVLTHKKEILFSAVVAKISASHANRLSKFLTNKELSTIGSLLSGGAGVIIVNKLRSRL